jgi:hypothetical protein
MKYRRLKTEKETNNRKSHAETLGEKPSLKFNLISCRGASTLGNKIILDPIEEISNN